MKSRPAAVIFILVTVTLDILAMGLIIPVLPKLILDFLGGEMTDAAKWSARFAVVFALARRFVRPLRKAPNHSAFESRPWTGLHRDGDGAHAELAVPRPNYFRNNDFEYSDGDGLYRRRYSEGEASRSLWSHRCGVRHRFHVRTCHWWIGWRFQSSSRILDCSCSQPRKLALGLLLRSRIAIART